MRRRGGQIVALAAGHKRPVVYPLREFAEIGGLVSYGRDLVDGYRQIGVYAGRILRGEKPADLPVVQPTKFEFVINLKTAKTLGLEIAPAMLARADVLIDSTAMSDLGTFRESATVQVMSVSGGTVDTASERCTELHL
jgi:putative ABC transport system substrate-binding protein